MTPPALLRSVVDGIRSSLSPQETLEEAVRVLQEALALLHEHKDQLPSQTLQQLNDTSLQLRAETEDPAASNSLSTAKGIKKRAKEFKNGVRREIDNATNQSLQANTANSS